MKGREGERVRCFFALLLALSLWLLGPAAGQEGIASSSTVGERAFPYKALPLEIWIQRDGQRLPVTQVPELKVGDLMQILINLDAPELTSLNAQERQRLHDWSIGWFLTTPEGSLVFDSTRKGQTDRGRIDLERGQNEITIKVEHDRQKFPILFLVRTRTLESWEEIRKTRQTKASNFIDHFGRYSDVVGDYESLQVFLKSLQREQPQAETLEGRLSSGFSQLGFTVDSKMRLSDPQIVAKLLGELETSLGSQGNTFKAEAAGKMLSQMLGDSDLGVIGAAVAIGGVLYRVTDYSESYHWSSARLKASDRPAHYWVMSAERIRHGENEQAPDGSPRANVRSILVCTPMAAETAAAPQVFWTSDAPNSLMPGSAKEPPEVRVIGDTLTSGTHPALVSPYLSPMAKVWDSKHGDSSPLQATVTEDGTLRISGLDQLWLDGDTKVEVRVSGRWGFGPLPLASFVALRSLPAGSLTMPNAPYLLGQNRRYRLELQSATPLAIGRPRFAGREVKIEVDGGKPYVVLEPGRTAIGPTKLEIYAGQGMEAANLLLAQEFWVIAGSNFHVLLPAGAATCELIAEHPDLGQALEGVQAVKIGSTTFQRRPDTLLFSAPQAPTDADLKEPRAELLFAQHGSVPDVHLEIAKAPTGLNLQVFSNTRTPFGPYQIELEKHLMANGVLSEFRLRSNAPWAGETVLDLELQGPAGQTVRQSFAANPQADQKALRIKGDLLFGDFQPQGAGRLACRLRVPIAGSQLPLEWTVPTPWQVVDVPKIQAAYQQGQEAVLEGEDLDITIARVFRSADPAIDPQGAVPERQASGGYRLDLSDFNPDEFWIELSDLRGQSKRFRVQRRSRTP
jgi:hypothetical protein